ncbi:hypothetical protein [Salinisphaera sp. G21_0]|uniref:hypothetical protein n=1 Tax=Salinisphaera sp. G21_0 TaxID=2821094 RepID=UPI001ADAC3DA|nr:hypothetical protein [Salinisphaera sp. G21_0]MBO9482271.1 hypothetical protein [Salinisphaera sp. G21_0]
MNRAALKNAIRQLSQDSYTASGLANLLYQDLLSTENGIDPKHTTTEQLHIATALKQFCQNIDKAVAEMEDGEGK